MLATFLLLHLLLTMTLTPPRPSLAVLLPPEEHDYPLYDLPSVQYLPHNSLVDYQGQERRQQDDAATNLEIATRSTYFPVPSSDSSSFSLPASSSSSSQACTAEDLAAMLNTEDLYKLVRMVGLKEGKSVENVLIQLAIMDTIPKERETPRAKPPLSYKGRTFHSGGSDKLRKLQGLSSSPPGPRLPLVAAAAPQQGPTVLHLRPPVALHHRQPPPGLTIVDGQNTFDVEAVEVPAISPRGVFVPPQAVLVVLDGGHEEVAKTSVDLGPRMSLLDVLKEAKTVFALNNGPSQRNPFAFKAARVEGERCLGVVNHTVDPGDALVITITRTLPHTQERYAHTRPHTQVIWESPCLPRVADLLVRRDDVIVLAPR